MSRYLPRKGTASPSSAKTYSIHLTAFAFFIFKQNIELDYFIDSVKAGRRDPYDALADFAGFLRSSKTGENVLGGNQISQMVKTAKNMQL
jgi:hypothetical protein